MKRISAVLATVIVAAMASFLVFSGFAYQTQDKIGFIDTNRIFDEFSEFQKATGKLETEKAPYEAEMDRMQNEFNQKRAEFEEQSLLMSEERRAQTNKDLNDLYQQIQEYGMQHFGQDGTIAQMSAELTDPILEEVRETIKRIGEDLEYDFILDGTSDAILFAKETKDITDVVLTELEKGK